MMARWSFARRLRRAAPQVLLLAFFLEAKAPLVNGASAPEKSGTRIIKDIPYPGARPGERRRSLDLYLPKISTRKAPLLIFVHGGFWLLTDDEYRIGAQLAQSLVQEGVAVALLRYRIAPGDAHPAQAQDVAAGVGWLVKEAGRYGYDSGRIYLSGHSAGAHLAALVVLDGRYLAERLVNGRALAGVILFSGIYNLAPQWPVSDSQRSATEKAFGTDTRTLNNASPVSRVRGGMPPFLILNAAQDFPGFALDARKFADALRGAGNADIQQYQVRGVDHFTLVRLEPENNSIRRAVLAFMGVKPLSAPLADWIESKRRWADPPFSTRGFWKDHALVRSYDVDERFLRMLRFVYRNRTEELSQWPLKQFHAIGLLAYLDARGREQVGEGDYLVLSNVRGEKQVWHRNEIESYEPVIVVGLDDERNLFRLSTFYLMHREYSWKAGPPTPLLALTTGAFIHFLKEPPRELQAQSWHYGLTESGFRRMKDDPLKAIRDLPKEVQEALTYRNGCVYCHEFRGAGARSHHVQGLTGKVHGGFALPLESYPAEVWKAFIFDQERVAREMGAVPNTLQEKVKTVLFELVNQSRAARGAKP
jgi:acetyl esterase/lipase